MSLTLIVALIVGSGLYLTAGVGWARNELPRIWEWAYREFSYGEAVRIWTGGSLRLQRPRLAGHPPRPGDLARHHEDHRPVRPAAC